MAVAFVAVAAGFVIRKRQRNQIVALRVTPPGPEQSA